MAMTAAWGFRLGIYLLRRWRREGEDQRYARILKKHPVILVTTYLKPEEVRKANMIPASTPDEALEIAYQMKDRDASVVVIPDGVSVLAVKE